MSTNDSIVNSVLASLDDLIAVLSDCGAVHESRVLIKIRAILTDRRDLDQFLNRLGGGEVWGSAGSVLDFNFPRECANHVSDAQVSRYWSAMIEILEGLIALGDPQGRAEETLSIVREWSGRD